MKRVLSVFTILVLALSFVFCFSQAESSTDWANAPVITKAYEQSYQLVFFRGTVYCYCFVTPENLEPIYLSLCDIRFFPEAQIENDGIASRQCQENIGQNQQITQEKT